MNELRSMADMFRDQLGSGVVVLGSQNEGKVNLVAAATKDAVQKVFMPVILFEVAKTAAEAVADLIWLKQEVRIPPN